MAAYSCLLAGKSHGQRSLEGNSPWGHKDSDTTERLMLFEDTSDFLSGGGCLLCLLGFDLCSSRHSFLLHF